jgi:predicted transglutaminase-like cysteine proteinase
VIASQLSCRLWVFSFFDAVDRAAIVLVRTAAFKSRVVLQTRWIRQRLTARAFAITPTSDEAPWGVADHWSPPFEILQTHRGDCEDYAIVKYVALLQAGLSHDDVKIVI